VFIVLGLGACFAKFQTLNLDAIFALSPLFSVDSI
jgi:hypothetical protein